ncbi:MAG: DUF2062 domain-containing protein [Nitrospirae bacterium]|nr:DUF2062 domain-containing protein [Nitrospirota bacterium]
MNYIRDRIRSLFQLNDPPNMLATAFAVGIFIAFSPTIGLHTASVFFFAWIFRLNKLVVFTAAFVNNPWTMVPLYGFCLWFGIIITGSTIVTPVIAWQTLTVSSAYHILRPYLWPFVAGTVVAGVIAAMVSYFFIYWAVVRYRRERDREKTC